MLTIQGLSRDCDQALHLTGHNLMTIHKWSTCLLPSSLALRTCLVTIS